MRVSYGKSILSSNYDACPSSCTASLYTRADSGRVTGPITSYNGTQLHAYGTRTWWPLCLQMLQDLMVQAHCSLQKHHYDDFIMGRMGSQITSLTTVYSTVYSGADQSKHQSSASLAFVWGIHRRPVTRQMIPFDDVIMIVKEVSLSIIGLILGLHPANERHHYKVTLSLIGWAQT